MLFETVLIVAVAVSVATMLGATWMLWRLFRERSREQKINRSTVRKVDAGFGSHWVCDCGEYRERARLAPVADCRHTRTAAAEDR
jgi:hypothetical protein